ncbi:MAG: hypothetical protein J3Q66DRAFT_402421 [Benniella sp.]|nr:MAG: hypothetical protein J3Q66DRAFT_402421 [Benniella sp.]
MLSNKPAHFLAIVAALIMALVSAVSAVRRIPLTRRVTIHPEERFCLLLPRNLGAPIASNLDDSFSYCNSPTSVVRHAKLFPTGFIRTSHYAEGPDGSYTQVTGRFDRVTFGLLPTDNGGQANPGYPMSSQCVGFQYFVQFVEPNEEIYCLRCCHNKSDCPTNMPDKGCRVVIPGHYT